MLIKEQLFRSEIAMSVMTSHEIWAYPIYMATPLMDPDFHGLKVTILKVFHFYLFYFYFIYLPHTIKYIINKNAKDYNK